MEFKLNKIANKYPSLFSGVWFGIAALICCSLPASMFFLEIVTRSDMWSQAFNFRLLAFIQFSVIPLIAGFVTGATIGSIILRSNKMSQGKSFLMGGLVTVISIFLWGFIGRILYQLYAYSYQGSAALHDTPGAAMAFAEGSVMTIVILLIILVVIFFGGLVGMSLFSYNSKVKGAKIKESERA
jgi:hypothetical protein